MSKHLLIAASFVIALTAGFAVHSAEKEEAAKAKPACPVSGKPINEDFSVEHNGGKVYFCCPGCPQGFAKNKAKFEPKANQQLLITGQAKQVKCPIAGRDLNPATAIDVAGTQVAFCCNNCKGKAEKAEGEEQLGLIFAAAPFKKGFEVGKAKK